jgi:hypothetical protein
MTQQTITNEGAFDYNIRTKINSNFTEVYNRGIVARQTADVTATSSTTLANLTGLVQTVEVGTYKFKISLQALSTGNGGTKVGLKYTTAALTSIQAEAKAFTASAVAVTRFTTTTDQASIIAATVANICLEIEGTMVVSAAGTVQVQGAQNASHSDTTTYYTGSTFEITKL